jgi:glycosyltransferase involved in cell wall biosynthesis
LKTQDGEHLVNSSLRNVTVVVPYYNERDSLPYLLQQLLEQTLPPQEVILVNSSSTDDSSQIIDSWIETMRPSISFRNLDAATHTPGASKSAGVKSSQSEIFAFMDCGLKFPNDWLRRQMAVLEDPEVDWVSGVCLTEGATLVDKAAIAHTYGFQTARPVIPGSVVRRGVFDCIGLFKNLRAGYDVEWARASHRAGLRRLVNHDVVVEYHDVNFAADVRGVFMKSLRYARPSVGRDDTLTPYFYLLASILGVALTVAALVDVMPAVFLAAAVATYLVARFIIASRKSQGLSFFLRSPLRLVVLSYVGFVMDLGKACGFVAGLFRRHILREELIS